MKKIFLSLLAAISLGSTGCSAQSDGINVLSPKDFIKQAKADIFSMYAHLANIKKSIWLEPSNSTSSIARSSMPVSNCSTSRTPIMYIVEAENAAIMPV